jgi:hypothetical protein
MSAEFPQLTPACQPAESTLLVVLPNGEAVRASLVRAVFLEELAGLIGQEVVRFRVVVELDDGSVRVVGTDLTRAEATDVARRTGRLVNDMLRGS